MKEEHIHLLNSPNRVKPRHLDSTNAAICSQGYLLSSEQGGINAEYAWQFHGGNGEGKIKFIDIEQGWIQAHESLEINTLTLSGISHPQFEDHGAAVLGVIAMRNNKPVGTGIVPMADAFVVSTWRPDHSYNIADAIRYAISCLSYGDIILLEEQVYGSISPTCFLPAETKDDIYYAIHDAVNLGITVIEPAGNGFVGLKTGVNLDTLIIREGKDILNQSSSHYRDSGAIMVAASISKSPHTPVFETNFGSRINCFAWGEAVGTSGNFPGFSNGFKNKYTNSFCGTSSAAAIIAGLAIAVQSIAEANYNIRLSPLQMRDLLSDERFGTRSKNGFMVDKIGVMPDLRKIIDHALPVYFGTPAKTKKAPV